MIKLTATALIHSISPVLQVSERFQKRELVLNDSWVKDGDVHPNFVLIEFSGDKMQQLDSFQPGQRVTVEAYINGREYQGKYYNSIKGLSVAPYQPQTAQGVQYQPQQSAAPQYAPPSAPASNYPPRTTAPAYQQPQYPPGQQQYNQPHHSPSVADLPFPH